MEHSKTQADIRKENFERNAKRAHDLADLALSEVDDALQAVYTPSIVIYERMIGHAVKTGEIDATEATEALRAYELWVTTGDSGLIPIEDTDTLAQPIGYYALQTSILD